MEENRDVYYNFLEELRRSGVTNMFGATPYLEAQFEELSHSEAMEILKDWMKNYSELSKRLGWDRELAQETSEEEFDYSTLFDEEIDKDTIDSFIKLLVDNENMTALDNANHIYLIPSGLFVVMFNDGSQKFFYPTSDEMSIYDDASQWAEDFGYNTEKVLAEIEEKISGVERKAEPEEEPVESEGEEEVVEYGTDAVIDDEFQETDESLKEGYVKPNWLKIDTGLTGELDKAILDSLMAQLSDGFWEDSPRMKKYWQNMAIEMDGDKVIIRCVPYLGPYFNWDSEQDVKRFFATHLKQYVKQWMKWQPSDDFKWDRNCEYLMSGMGFHDPEPTVADVYRVYDKLLGRKDRINKFDYFEALKEATSSVYFDMLDEYLRALARAEKQGIVLFTVTNEDEENISDDDFVYEQFDTFDEAKDFAKENGFDKILISSFGWEGPQGYDNGDYIEYDEMILDLNKKPVSESFIRESDNNDEEEPKLETFEDKINFLVKDEDEAIAGYDKVLALLGEEDANAIEQLTHLKEEEIAHRDFLLKLKEDKNAVYEHEDEKSLEDNIEESLKEDLDSSTDAEKIDRARDYITDIIDNKSGLKFYDKLDLLKHINYQFTEQIDGSEAFYVLIASDDQWNALGYVKSPLSQEEKVKIDLYKDIFTKAGLEIVDATSQNSPNKLGADEGRGLWIKIPDSVIGESLKEDSLAETKSNEFRKATAKVWKNKIDDRVNNYHWTEEQAIDELATSMMADADEYEEPTEEKERERLTKVIKNTLALLNKTESLNEDEELSKGAKICKVIADAFNEAGMSNGVFGQYEYNPDPENPNKLVMESQGPDVILLFNDDGSIDLENIEEVARDWAREAFNPEEQPEDYDKEINDIIESFAHFDSIKDILMSDLSPFYNLGSELIEKTLDKVNIILDEPDYFEA